MGSLILCHRKRAKQPYEITRVHRKIYTIEELCYYICNNLYLIDYTMINHQMCDWIERELELSDLAGRLRGTETESFYGTVCADYFAGVQYLFYSGYQSDCQYSGAFEESKTGGAN